MLELWAVVAGMSHISYLSQLNSDLPRQRSSRGLASQDEHHGRLQSPSHCYKLFCQLYHLLLEGQVGISWKLSIDVLYLGFQVQKTFTGEAWFLSTIKEYFHLFKPLVPVSKKSCK